MITYKYGIQLMEISFENLDLLRLWRNDQKIMAWTRQSDLISENEQLNWYSSLLEDKTKRMYIVHRDLEGPVGVCGLTSLDQQNQRAEFSLYIAPEHQKNGYAGAALMTLFRHGFMNLNLNLIWGETFHKNPAAKLFEKIGMKKEGTRRSFYFKDGKFIDAHLYSILRSEFKI